MLTIAQSPTTRKVSPAPLVTQPDMPFAAAVRKVSDLAHAKLPDSLHGRLQRATALVLAGAVWMEDDGSSALVQSSSGQTWYEVNGHCTCEDAPRAPDGYCKHRLSKAIYRRASDLLREPLPQLSDTLTAAPVETPQDVPRQHVVMIQGRPFVKFAGLLEMAHARGLVSLTADWTYNDADLSLAHAVATFQDGRRFEESGDATPGNTTRKIAAHFRRVALTRAKARVLRDALGVDLVAVEELADSE